MSTLRPIILAFLFALGLTSGAQAQTPTASFPEWVTLSAGAANGVEAVDFHLSYNTVRWDLPLHAGLDLMPSGLFGNRTYLRRAVATVAVGHRMSGEWLQMAQFVGPSVMYARERWTLIPITGPVLHGYDDLVRPGLAAEAQFYLKPFGRLAPEMGIGLELFGNLNAVQSYYGVRFGLMINNTR